MAINQGFVDLGQIVNFIKYLQSPNQGDVLEQILGGGGGATNPFEAALATPSEVAGGAQPGPTREAQAIGAATPPQPAGMSPRALLQRMLDNPRLLSDLSTENFNKLIDVNTGLTELEPTPATPTSQQQNLSTFEQRFGPTSREVAGTALNVLPTPPNDIQLLAEMNADRASKGLTPYGTEEGLRILANLRNVADTSVTVSPQINVDAGTGEIVSAFMTKEMIDKQNARLLELEPTIEQLQRVQKLLQTPGSARLIASPIIRGVASGAAAVESLSGYPALSQFGVTPEELGQNITMLKSGVSGAAAQIAKIYEADLSEPTRKRLEELAQIGDMTSNPDQALGAVNELLNIMLGLQQQTAKGLRQGGSTLNEPRAETPQTRVDFNLRVNAEADRIFKANPKKYPNGRKDRQLLLDAIQAADRASPTPQRALEGALDGGQ